MRKADKTALIEAITGSYGIITTIATRLKVNWNTARSYIREDKEATELFEAERNRILDKAESVVIDALEKMDLQTAKWYLTTKGHDRGYSNKDQTLDTLDDGFGTREYRRKPAKEKKLYDFDF
jgi:hypothetical protein